MSKKAAFGLAKNEAQAHRLINRLNSSGFNGECISFLMYDRENRLTRENANGRLETIPGGFAKHSVGHEKHTKMPEGAAIGATTGGVIGGTLGLLAGLGALAIPGIGPFVAAGPIMAALGGSAAGGGAGLLLGGLIGFGVPEYEAKQYEGHLKAGHILISVEASDSPSLNKAKKILKEEGAEDIACVGIEK